jgi:vacuolar-type H+-ATPase subunit I/STV1
MCLFTGLIYAQEGGQRGQRGQRLSTEERVKAQTDRMKKDFELTEVQYDSVKKINLKYAKKNEEVFRNNREDAEKNRGIFQKNQEEQNKELKAILNETQYKKYEEQLKARRERLGNREPGQQGQRQNQRPRRDN